ncbi:rhomboid family intramembrane serine protease [candidate division KSB1 bacterium]
MRQLDTFENEDTAQTLSDILYAKEIKNRLDAEDDGTWILWIYDEEQMDEARIIMREFLNKPDNKDYKKYIDKAKKIKDTEEKEERDYRKRVEASRVKWLNIATDRFGPVTKVMIIISVAVFLISSFGMNKYPIQGLFISKYIVPGRSFLNLHGLPEIMSGEIWRLVTPIFIHFGFMHIVFNMLWLRSLGSQVENIHSSRYYIFLVIVIAAVSNFSQYTVTGPNFGGMSGVVYGLLGYIWFRGRYDPASGLELNPTIVKFMIVWFIICLTGIIGNVANVAHGTGLASGMTWGYISGNYAVMKRKMR